MFYEVIGILTSEDGYSDFCWNGGEFKGTGGLFVEGNEGFREEAGR